MLVAALLVPVPEGLPGGIAAIAPSADPSRPHRFPRRHLGLLAFGLSAA